MNNFRFLLPAILLWCALPARADTQSSANQSHAEIIETIAVFVRAQTQDLPGKVTIKVDEIDRHLVRPACPNLEAFLPSGSQLLGNSMVGVRCSGKKSWSLFVPVHVRVSVDVLIASKPLPQGHTLLATDLASQNAELTETGILVDPAQALGKVLKNGVGSGQVLKQDMLRAPYAVTQGQTVQLQVEGAGFSVLSEGHALNSAAEGQAVQVKTTSGKVVSGTVRPGGMVGVRP